MIHPTNPEHAAIIERLAEVLKQGAIGNVMTYGALNQFAQGRDLQAGYRYLLEAAREKAEKDMGCIFECVRGEGIKRLAASECPEVGLSAIRRVRSAAKRGVRRLTRLNTNSLSEGENKRVISYRSMLGAISMIADGNKARTVAAVVDPANPIPPERILDMFRA